MSGSFDRWYAKIPKDPASNRQFRRDLIVEGNSSDSARDWLRRCCREDTLFYLNAFVWTYDPRLTKDKMVPFITYPFQDGAIREIEKSIEIGRDLVVEKSRDTGASWMCVAIFEKRWHFLPDQTFMVMSRNANAVDGTDNEDSLFAKIDRIHKYLPEWMMPLGWNAFKNRNRFSLRNPELDSTIAGGATVGDAAVGGRRTAILLDEFSRIEEGKEINVGTADVTPCRIFNFTAYGKENEAYELLKNPYKKKLRLHWSQDPRKNQKLYKWDAATQRFRYYRFDDDSLELQECSAHEYTDEDADTRNFDPPGRAFKPVADGVLRSPEYDREDTRRGNRKYMAINWDIDYEGSDDHFFDLKLLLELNVETVRPHFWEGDIEVDEATGELVSFVEETGGPLRLWCHLDEKGLPPVSERGYGAGCDISWGQGATPSCCAIADAQTGEKVLEYVTPFEKPERFCSKVVALCNAFRSRVGTNTHLAWERLGPGNVFGQRIVELGYANVYYHGTEANKDFTQTRKAGWPPNRNNTAELLGDYQAALRTRRYLNRSQAALKEAEGFVETERGIQSSKWRAVKNRLSTPAGDAQSGSRESHGDRVVMDALCLLAIKQIGGGAVVAKPDPPKPPEEIVGTFAWRKRLHELRAREQEDNWGY